MWLYPRCGAWNFDEGPCKCCGYGGKIVHYTNTTSTDNQPLVK